MAARAKSKVNSRASAARSPARKAPVKRASAKTAVAKLSRAELEKECTRLTNALARSKKRVEELERVNAEVANRIDWVMDSLQGILDRKN